jgi:hypothetical protein
VWDAGRIVPAGSVESFQIRGLGTAGRTRLVLRVAPTRSTTIDVQVDGKPIGDVSFAAHDGWLEPSVIVLPQYVAPTLQVRMSSSSERVIHHVWVVELP